MKVNYTTMRTKIANGGGHRGCLLMLLAVGLLPKGVCLIAKGK